MTSGKPSRKARSVLHTPHFTYASSLACAPPRQSVNKLVFRSWSSEPRVWRKMPLRAPERLRDPFSVVFHTSPSPSPTQSLKRAIFCLGGDLPDVHTHPPRLGHPPPATVAGLSASCVHTAGRSWALDLAPLVNNLRRPTKLADRRVLLLPGKLRGFHTSASLRPQLSLRNFLKERRKILIVAIAAVDKGRKAIGNRLKQLVVSTGYQWLFSRSERSEDVHSRAIGDFLP